MISSLNLKFYCLVAELLLYNGVGFTVPQRFHLCVSGSILAPASNSNRGKIQVCGT